MNTAIVLIGFVTGGSLGGIWYICKELQLTNRMLVQLLDDNEWIRERDRIIRSQEQEMDKAAIIRGPNPDTIGMTSDEKMEYFRKVLRNAKEN